MTEEKLKEAPILYTLKEVAAILQLSERTVYSRLYEGKIKGVKAGHGWRISKEALQEYLDGGKP